jgi:hypothetical protein
MNGVFYTLTLHVLYGAEVPYIHGEDNWRGAVDRRPCWSCWRRRGSWACTRSWVSARSTRPSPPLTRTPRGCRCTGAAPRVSRRARSACPGGAPPCRRGGTSRRRRWPRRCSPWRCSATASTGSSPRAARPRTAACESPGCKPL